MSTAQPLNVAYGLSEPLIQVYPLPIISKRNPTIRDKAQIGTEWVNTVTNSIFFLTSVVNNNANWLTPPAGAGSFLSVTATLGDITADLGNIVASAGSISAALSIDAGTSLSAATTVTAGTGLTVTTGGISSTGDVTLNGGDVNIATDAVQHAVVIGNVTGNTGLTLRSGTSGIALSSTGAGDITAASSDTLLLDSAGVLELNSSAGIISIGNDAVSQNINIGTAGTRTITVGNSTATTGVTINSGTGNINIGTNAIAHTVEVGNNIALTSFQVDVGAGGVCHVGTTGTVHESAFGTGTGASKTLIQGGADLTGGIILTSGGFVSMDHGSDTQASPSATAVLDIPVGYVTFTGFTTAAGASQVFTITNASVTATSPIFVTAANLGANDAQMTVTRVTPGAGTFDVTLTNNGAQALNGDVTITFWAIA